MPSTSMSGPHLCDFPYVLVGDGSFLVKGDGPFPVTGRRTVERFWNKIDICGPNDCWLWTASTQSRGYGQFYLAGTVVLAHRLAYELVVGAVPDGQQVDHLCRVLRCCNPSHLESVTQQENILRQYTYARTQPCKRGHSADDRFYRADGRSECRLCVRERDRARGK